MISMGYLLSFLIVRYATREGKREERKAEKLKDYILYTYRREIKYFILATVVYNNSG